MSRLEEVLDKYDLKTLESAVRRKRNQEERRLARLVGKRRKLEDELKKVERDIKSATEAARKADGQIVRKPNARRLNEISLAEALEKVMKKRKTPIHYRELTDTVLERGLYKTKSKNLLSTVAVTLKRDKRFKKVEPGFYTLR
jgi:hypothetical protein